jgi:hypothetical protein
MYMYTSCRPEQTDFDFLWQVLWIVWDASVAYGSHSISRDKETGKWFYFLLVSHFYHLENRKRISLRDAAPRRRSGSSRYWLSEWLTPILAVTETRRGTSLTVTVLETIGLEWIFEQSRLNRELIEFFPHWPEQSSTVVITISLTACILPDRLIIRLYF